MSNVGPVCHIPPANSVADPQARDIPGIPGPAQANVQSLQHVVNQLREMVIFLSGQQGPAGASSPKPKPARWTEDKPARVTNKTRVFQNNDPTSQNWVDIETIDALSMKDGVTGESWKWSK